MQLTVTGKQVDVGGALRRHVETSLDAFLGKYFRTAIEAHAVFAHEAHLIRTDLSLHIGRGIMIKSGATASDYYPAFDAAAERLAKQLRRYKRRLRSHHRQTRIHAAALYRSGALLLATLLAQQLGRSVEGWVII